MGDSEKYERPSHIQSLTPAIEVIANEEIEKASAGIVNRVVQRIEERITADVDYETGEFVPQHCGRFFLSDGSILRILMYPDGLKVVIAADAISTGSVIVNEASSDQREDHNTQSIKKIRDRCTLEVMAEICHGVHGGVSGPLLARELLEILGDES